MDRIGIYPVHPGRVYMASNNPARGMRDFVPTDIRKRNYVIGIIKEVYESYGFEPLGVEASFKKKIDADSKSIKTKAILAVNEMLDRLGVKNFAIYISHSDVLTGILETVRVPHEVHKHTFAAIRAFNKYNLEGFISELQDVGVSENASMILADLFLKIDEILNQEHDINRTVVSNLLNIVSNETLSELGQVLRSTGRTPVLIDPALAFESPYGPGLIFEARTSGLDVLGNGGCAENEPALFTFSFDVETIVALMENSGVFPPAMTETGSAVVL